MSISNSTQAVIGFVHPLDVKALFMRSVVDAVRKYNYPIASVMSGPNVSRARNKVVENFLKFHEGIDWLFMVDTDMAFTEDTILNLLSCNEPVISGLCLTGGEHPVPAMYSKIRSGPDKGQYISVNEWPTDDVIDVDVAGSACMLINRSVFEDIQAKFPNPAAQWYQEEQVGDHLIGEDFTFCERARRVGYNIKVNTAAQVGHIKGSMIGNVK